MRPTPRLRRKAHRKGWSREATHKRQCRNHNRGWNAAADMFPPPALVIIGGEGCTTVLPGRGKAQAGLLRSASSAASGILVLTVRAPSRLRDVLSRHREDQATDGSAQVYERQGDVVHSCGRHGEHMVESATATRALL